MKRMNTKFNSPFCSKYSLGGISVWSVLFLVLGSMLVVNEVQGQTNTWDGSTDNDWHEASNWSLNATPTSSHNIVIDIDADIELTSPTSLIINSLRITSSATVSFTAISGNRAITIDSSGNSIDSGSILTLNGSSSNYMAIGFSGSSNDMDIDGSLILTSVGGGGRYNATSSETTVSGLLKNDSAGGGSSGEITSSSSNLTFSSGGIYELSVSDRPIPSATWDAASVCKITGSTSALPGNLGQTFGTLIVDCSSYTGSSFLPFSGMSIAGDFEVLNTGSGTILMSQTPLNVGGDCIISDDFTMASSANKVLDVSGDFIMNGGTLTMSFGSKNGTINVAGDCTLSGGVITETSNGQGDFVFNKTGVQLYTSGATISETINFTVSSGSILQMASSSTVVESGGVFYLTTGAR